MNIDLSNRVVAVTGGSAGIGAGIAKMVAQCGAKVAVIARATKTTCKKLFLRLKRTVGRQ